MDVSQGLISVKYDALGPLVVNINSDGVSALRRVASTRSPHWAARMIVLVLPTLSWMTNWPWPKMTPAASEREWTFRVLVAPK